MGRGSRALRRKAAVDDGSVGDVEFAELLDPIALERAQVDVVTAPIVAEEPVLVTSRFADAGIDDDRLPAHPAKRRAPRG